MTAYVSKPHSRLVHVDENPRTDAVNGLYECGHRYVVPNSMIMAHGRRGLPPVCPTCNPMMPALTQETMTAAYKRQAAFDVVREHTMGTSHSSWLDKQVTTVRSRAWH